MLNTQPGALKVFIKTKDGTGGSGMSPPSFYHSSTRDILPFPTGYDSSIIISRRLFVNGMANVRLLQVRCYLDGAQVSSSNKLHLTLAHAGMETLVDDVKKPHEFKHKAQILTGFKYHLETKEIELASTIGRSARSRATRSSGRL
jgi:hypothetical protein